MRHPLLAVAALSIVLAGWATPALLSQSKTANKVPLCETSAMPENFQRILETDYSSWRIQEPSNLGSRAKERWESEKPLACPGIAVGQFEIPSQSSYAVLLVPKNDPNSAYKLIVFTPNPTNPADSLKIADAWEKGEAADNFIHVVAIAKVFSVEWIRKLNANAKDGILAVESGEKNYGVEVFFWSKGKYRHESLDD